MGVCFAPLPLMAVVAVPPCTMVVSLRWNASDPALVKRASAFTARVATAASINAATERPSPEMMRERTVMLVFSSQELTGRWSDQCNTSEAEPHHRKLGDFEPPR